MLRSVPAPAHGTAYPPVKQTTVERRKILRQFSKYYRHFVWVSLYLYRGGRGGMRIEEGQQLAPVVPGRIVAEVLANLLQREVC